MVQITKVTKKSSEKLSLRRKKALFLVLLHYYIIVQTAVVAIQRKMFMAMVASCRFRNIVHNSALRGPAFVLELLNGHPTRMFNILRVTPDCFIKLSSFLSERTSLRDTKVTVEEKLAIFLYITANNISNRCAQDRFQRGGCTISKAFHQVLDAFFSVKDEVIEPPRHEKFPSITDDPRMVYFENCIGAIDETHIPITLPNGDESYRCRKGFPSLNVMVAVDFNMKFRNVHSGWEGSAHDARVLAHALENNFFVIPDGTYYLADAGYGISDKILTPYRNVRYHLKEYGNNTPRNGKELFNMRHSSLRNVVERAIGKFKNRFKILKEASEYSADNVACLVISLAVVHNLIEDYNKTAKEILKEEKQLERYDDDDDDDDDEYFNNNNQSSYYGISTEARVVGSDRRDAIDKKMWQNYKR